MSQYGQGYPIAHSAPPSASLPSPSLPAVPRQPAALLRLLPPQYEYSDPISFGGPTTARNAAYKIDSAFATPCEYCVISVAFGGAGQALLAPDMDAEAPAINGTLDATARKHGFVAIAGGATTITYPEAYHPLPANAALYLATTLAGGNSAYATLRFRRAVAEGSVPQEGQL